MSGPIRATSNNRPLRCRWQQFVTVATLVLLLLAQAGCTIKLVASYDAETDRAVTALQRKLETFFIALEVQFGSPQADYGEHAAFYREVKVDISALKLRARALPKNELTLKQVELLDENLALLESVHREGINAIEVVQVVRDDFNTALANILQLELAKRRGENQ
ncbi:MAG: hypothetical protein WBN40_09695 [Pseudomonadales bacterium]